MCVGRVCVFLCVLYVLVRCLCVVFMSCMFVFRVFCFFVCVCGGSVLRPSCMCDVCVLCVYVMSALCLCDVCVLGCVCRLCALFV